MAVQLERGVDFPMVDLANIAYYPRIFDLAHRFFEDAWKEIGNIRCADVLLIHKTGFPVVHVESDFHAPLRYGDTITSTIWLDAIGESSCAWCYEFHNQNKELLWTSSQVTVCVDMDSMKRTTIPDDLRQGLEACRRDE